jgi:hypothetical protein
LKQGLGADTRNLQKRRKKYLNLYAQILVVVTMGMLVGCTTTPTAKLDRRLLQPSPTMICSVIPESNVSIPINIEPIPYHPQQGILDAVVNGIEDAGIKARNEARRKAASQRLSPLWSQTADMDFRTTYWNAIRECFGSTASFQCAGIETNTALVRITRKIVKEHPLLYLKTDFELSGDSSTVKISTSVEYYNLGNTELVCGGTLIYFSDAIGSEQDDAAIAKWSEAGATAYREAIRNGISETTRMLRLGLLEAPEPSAPDQTIKVRCPQKFFNNSGSGYSMETWQGRTLAENAARIIFQTDQGYLYSIPKQIIM